jgi:SAM-dependent methyltransferase
VHSPTRNARSSGVVRVRRRKPRATQATTARVSAWAAAHVRWPGEVGYTAQRLVRAEESVRELLAPLDRAEFGLAIDVGSGAGYNTFALAGVSRAVIGIDKRWRSVLLGRHIARMTGSDSVGFRRGDGARFERGPVADLVLSNLMSHGAGHRDSLLRALRRCARPGAWLIYSEVTEGYPLMEMTRAVRERDSRSFRARARQLIRGLDGGLGFRFFQSGTAAGVLARAGWRVERTEVSNWHGVPFTETHWAVAVQEPRDLEAGFDRSECDRAAARLGLPLARIALPRGLRGAWRDTLHLSADRLRASDWKRAELLASELEAALAERTGSTSWAADRKRDAL